MSKELDIDAIFNEVAIAAVNFWILNGPKTMQNVYKLDGVTFPAPKAAIERLLVQTRIEELKRSMMKSPDYTDEEFQFSLDQGLFYESDIKRLAQLTTIVEGGQ